MFIDLILLHQANGHPSQIAKVYFTFNKFIKQNGLLTSVQLQNYKEQTEHVPFVLINIAEKRDLNHEDYQEGTHHSIGAVYQPCYYNPPYFGMKVLHSWGKLKPSKCRTTIFCLSKHDIFCFINFRGKIMAASSIWMVCNHHPSMCFLDLICGNTLPVKYRRINQEQSCERKKRNKCIEQFQMVKPTSRRVQICEK